MELRTDEVLVVGADGMLGRAIVERLDARGVRAITPTTDKLDLRDEDSVRAAVPPDARAVINAAAWTDVDGAEEHEAEALVINADGPGALARWCADIGAHFTHFSTDYVFNGRARRPYPTDHPIDPVNAYGRTKAAGEQLVRAAGGDTLLIRTSWLYAPWGKNFVLTMMKLLRERDALRVVDDQRGRPTSALWLAEATLRLVEADATGLTHATDGGDCTWHEFTVEIRDRLGLVTAVEPCTSDEFPRPAPRPAYSVLALDDLIARLGEAPADWRENLRAVIERAVSAETGAGAENTP